MPTRNGAPLGAPCWIDLTTSDVDRPLSGLDADEVREHRSERDGVPPHEPVVGVRRDSKPHESEPTLPLSSSVCPCGTPRRARGARGVTRTWRTLLAADQPSRESVSCDTRPACRTVVRLARRSCCGPDSCHTRYNVSSLRFDASLDRPGVTFWRDCVARDGFR